MILISKGCRKTSTQCLADEFLVALVGRVDRDGCVAELGFRACARDGDWKILVVLEGVELGRTLDVLDFIIRSVDWPLTDQFTTR
jgi:hypothetical protein